MSGKAQLWATIDRIERDGKGHRLAVLVFDDGQQLVLPVEMLPSGIQAKQVVTLSIEVNPEETARRAAQIQHLQQQLFGD